MKMLKMIEVKLFLNTNEQIKWLDLVRLGKKYYYS